MGCVEMWNFLSLPGGELYIKGGAWGFLLVLEFVLLGLLKVELKGGGSVVILFSFFLMFYCAFLKIILFFIAAAVGLFSLPFPTGLTSV